MRRIFALPTLIIFLLASSSFISLFFTPPGLSANKAVGKYLNGVFPAKAPSDGILLEPAFPNITFDSPLTWDIHPQQDKIFVGQRDGKVYYFEDKEDVNTKTMFLDLSEQVGVVWDGGFLGFSFHPNFGKAGAKGRNYFYVFYSTISVTGANNRPTPQRCPEDALYDGAYLLLQRYEVNEGTLNVNLSKTIDMFRIRLYNSTHRGGGMVFGKDGYLYLTIGDQAQHSTAQDMSRSFDGGVLRLDVDMNAATSHKPTYTMPKDLPRAPDETSGNGYFIPDDNPFVGQENIFEEYYTLGHRNPHRMTMDALTGKMYIGEIGSSIHEEVNVVEKGKNYGWPVFEGARPYNRCTNQLHPGTEHKLPLVAFPRAEANSITGGYVYRGSTMPSLYGKYLCADYGGGGEIWSVDINSGEYTQIAATSKPISFGQDKNNELYILRLGNNVQLQRIVSGSAGFNPPGRLSQTNAFKDLQTLSPADGIIPYDMYESFWSDGAIKKRWLMIPNDGVHNSPEEQIEYTENGEWKLPPGSVAIKHFELPLDANNPALTKRLETRFTIIDEKGQVYGLTYKWNEAGTDADLLSGSLEEEFIVRNDNGVDETQTWYYPSGSDCLTCHNDAVGGTLGLRTRYLNNDLTYPLTGITANQLVTLSSLGIIPSDINPANVSTLPSNAAQGDYAASLEKRARSYLDLNCGYCHRPGTGNRGTFDARINTSLYFANFFSDQLNQSLGIAGEKVIFPGDTAKSVLYQRIHSTDPSIMMPPLAKGKIDKEGARLIADWIKSLDEDYIETCRPENIALNKTASQSSTYPSALNFEAGNAVDGNRNGASNANSITHTRSENQPWWEVDLGAIYSMKDIHIFNRTDCCGERLTNFYIFSSTQPFRSKELNPTLQDPDVNSIHVSGTAGTELYRDLGIEGRYVRIQLVGSGVLQLAEVEINGCIPEGVGLQATYYNSTDFREEAIKRTDKEINFNWGTASPDPKVEANTFSVRWEGQLLPEYSETYTFYTTFDDGLRLWVNNQLIVDNWSNQPPGTYTGTIGLQAGKKVDLKVEYYENEGTATAKLEWQSASQSREIIPTANLLKPEIIKKSQTITFGEIPDKLTVDTNFELNATASSGLAVRFDLVSGPAQLVGNTVNLDGEEGEVIIEAIQQGDRKYDPAEKVRRVFSVKKEAQEITFEEIPDKFIIDQPFELVASASSGLPVSFTLVEGPVSIDENIVTILGSVGEVIIEVTQEGNGQYYPADTVSKTFQISLPPSICELAGKITAEYWFGATGNEVKDIPLSRFPNAFVDRENFEAAVDTGDNYGLRMRGYICPPETGKYTFWIAADEEAELWLSTDRDPAHKSRIAFLQGRVGEREWEVSGSQRSVDIQLEAGEPYFIEALMKEEEGGDHLAVGWTLPDGTQQRPISGSYLSPYIPEEKVPQTISFSEIPDKSVTDEDFSLTATSSSGLEVSFIVRSGPASVSGNILSLEGVVGTVVVEAIQEGNPLFGKAPSVVRSFSVTNGGICRVDGQILQEIWSGLEGNTIADIPLEEVPASTIPLDVFEVATDDDDSYGTRVSGLICPPLTGNYTFYIAADDFGELWLSTDDSVKNKVKIASAPGWTNSREWDKYPEQTSAEIFLHAGQLYYVEALMIESGGGDNLAVGWKLPGGKLERPISGTHLGLPEAPEKLQQSISFNTVVDKQVGDPDFLISAKASSGLKVTYSIESGPATIQGRKVSLLGSVGEVQVKARQEGNTVYEPAESLLTFQVSGAGTFDCSDKGSISLELWENVSGEEIGDIPINKDPDAVSTLELFEIPTNVADEYGVRIRGYICPPLSGAYSFWLAADEQAELWLSTDDMPVNKRKIAHVYAETPYRGWDYRASQRSAPIKLLAGQRYYVEAIMKEGSGKDHLSVGWKLPTGEHERPIAGERLIPFSVSGASGGFTSLEEQVEASSKLIQIYPNPSTGTIYLRWQGKAGEPENYSIRLCDMRGKCLIEREVSSSEGKVDVSALSNGVYHVLLQAGDYQQTSRVMVLD